MIVADYKADIGSGAFQAIKDAGGEAILEAFAATFPVKRLGRPEELAYAALFLASDEASFVIGDSGSGWRADNTSVRSIRPRVSSRVCRRGVWKAKVCFVMWESREGLSFA